MTKHPLYDVWWNMRDRVLNPNHQFYHRYGGRGITICKEWSSDVVTFYNWAIVNGWEKGLQIDRRDNDGNYCPENCRFVLHTKNGQNRSTTIMDWKTINALRAEFEPGMNISLLGKKYGTKNISEILNNKIWYNKDYIVPDFLKNKEWIKMGNEKVNALRAEYEPGITQAFLAKKYKLVLIATGKMFMRAASYLSVFMLGAFSAGQFRFDEQDCEPSHPFS